MKKVTRVSQQRRPGRYNIYLDDEFALAVDEKILIQFDLFKGTEVDDEMLEEIQMAEFEQKAYIKGLTLATGRLIAKKQLVLKLKKAEFPNDIIYRVINRLEEAGILNDQAFAEAYVAVSSSNGKLGPRGIMRKLRSFGVDSDVIAEAMESYVDEDQDEHIVQQVNQLFAKYQGQSQFMARQKVSQKLIQNGFDSDRFEPIIQDYLAELDSDDKADIEWANLDREAQKAADRYAQYTGWDFTRRFKRALFRRGFRADLINKWLEENK
ncbi:regulatory protein RecX [Weissella oryzae SG25]|uniref:Regulatory protein RecX n=1 Tax=Weissella oryzae (strain DSM 25784 / JCM 18191 / LMG 30913 / SG25) TaxID=1329250 RepID=A0A069CT15_WEIOS|nr:RecX family transcriptional regulator [Weissella oryzae]GAK30547.1 regulatory protein RecX [Weissella oryzae SG25]